jgi:TfoX/Sxy family transcriptional regulator of competence genes
MAYDIKLAERIRAQLGGLPFVEKKMFGGIGFLIGGNMACGVYKEDLVVRVPREKHDALLKKPHVKPFDITGKPMKGWLLVEPGGCKSQKQLNAWVKEGVEFSGTLPPK